MLNIDERVNTTAQDVLVIAFGMNDALVNISGWRSIFNKAKEILGLGERGRFKRDTLAMINSIRKRHPETEFVLISGIRSNPEWGAVDNGLITQYRKEMLEIEIRSLAYRSSMLQPFGMI